MEDHALAVDVGDLDPGQLGAAHAGSIKNRQQRALLMVLYGTGMRRAEVARLKIADIDSQRMIIHVVDGKGHKDRDLRG